MGFLSRSYEDEIEIVEKPEVIEEETEETKITYTERVVYPN